MNFWGDHVHGKLVDLGELLHEDNPDNVIKVLPLQENKKYGSPQLMLTKRPSETCLDKISELYRCRLFLNDDSEDEFKYLMTIETLRFAFEEDWHWGNDKLSKQVTGNKWDFDGYFYVTDELNGYRRVAIIPFSKNAYEYDAGDNLSRYDALCLVKEIVKKLNNNELLIKRRL